MAQASYLDTSHQDVAWFADKSERGLLELRPPFQRRPVWNDEEKSFLVDSMLRGYPVPEVYVHSHTDDDVVDVVDGQQRLRTCLEFLSDGFPILFDVQKLRPLHTLEDTPWYGKKYSKLEKDERNAFRKYKFIVRDLQEVSDDQIRHMFHRLNQSNVALNAQELRYSMYSGGLLGTAEQLVDLDQWDHFRIFTTVQKRRMLDTEFISELIIGFLHWPQNKKENLDNYYRQYAADFPFAADVIDMFTMVLDYLVALFPRPRMDYTRWYRKSDFYTLFLALARGRIPMANADAAVQHADLIEFSSLVSGPESPAEPGVVGAYRFAVQRAATDRARRVQREDALVAFLGGDRTPAEPQADRGELPAQLVPDLEVDDDAETDAEYEDRPS